MELVARAVAGDRDAWAGSWDLHGPRLHSYARRLLGDEHDANDVVADTFVTAAEHLAELRDPEALRPWLYAISAVNDPSTVDTVTVRAVVRDALGRTATATQQLLVHLVPC